MDVDAPHQDMRVSPAETPTYPLGQSPQISVGLPTTAKPGNSKTNASRAKLSRSQYTEPGNIEISRHGQMQMPSPNYPDKIANGSPFEPMAVAQGSDNHVVTAAANNTAPRVNGAMRRHTTTSSARQPASYGLSGHANISGDKPSSSG